MKKAFFTTFALVAMVVFSSAQTIIPAGNVSGTWTITGSPYLIQGAIMIPNGTTLTIEPGVTVSFQGPYKLFPQGRLLAIGSVTDTITFTAADTTIGWLGIQYDYTPLTNDTSRFDYCKVQYSKGTGSNSGFHLLGFSKIVISNCLISNCISNNSPGGGGIYCSGSSPVITGNTITHNTTGFGGAGIFCENSSPIITNNTITYNTTSGCGGAIYCYGIFNSSSPLISNNIISNNSAFNGGGISTSNNSPVITHNFITNNTGFYGGGINCSNAGLPEINNNVISNNTAGANGGGIYCDYTYYNPAFSNNTISNNSATLGGGLYCALYSSVALYNTILWGNTAETSGHQVYLDDENSDPEFYYCDIQYGTDSFGLNTGIFYTGMYQNNIDSVPMFVAPSAGSGIGYNGTDADWSLQITSPCINAGTPDPDSLNLPATDLAGNPRIKGGRIDIGAYEYQSPSSIHEALNTLLMDIYPNPVSNNLTVEGQQLSEIEIFTIDGRMVKTIKGKDRKTTIDLEDLSSGVYLIKVKNDKGIAIKKFVKE